MTDKPLSCEPLPTLAEELKREEELARRRFVHHTRPKEPLSLDDAIALCRRVAGDDERGKG